MIDRFITSFPDTAFYCHKCGAKLEHSDVVTHTYGFNRYSGKREYGYFTEFKCPYWKRFHGHTKGIATLCKEKNGNLEWYENFFEGGW